jgi:hypothetical protein
MMNGHEEKHTAPHAATPIALQISVDHPPLKKSKNYQLFSAKHRAQVIVTHF